MSARNGLASKILLLVASPLVILLLVELVLGFVSDEDPLLHFAKPNEYREDPELIYSLLPGAGEHNSLGLRNAEIGPPDDRIRILALGDSYTFGHGVTSRQSYPKILQRKLRADARLGRGAEVINAGVPGYNFDQAFALFTRRLAGLAPDLVIVVFEPKDLGASNVLFDLENGALVERPAWQNWIYLQLWLRSHAPAWWLGSNTGRFVLGRLTGSDPFGTLPDGDLDALVAWQVEKILVMTDELVRRGRRDGFDVMIVNYPDRSALMHGGDYRFCTYYGLPTRILGARANEHVAALLAGLRRSGVVEVDAMAQLLARGWSEERLAGLYLEGDPHMSARGNALLAEMLHAAIVDPESDRRAR